MNILISSIILAGALAGCAHQAPCRQPTSENGKCEGQLRKVTIFAQRKKALESFNKTSTTPSKFEIIYSSIPKTTQKTFRGSSQREIENELNSIDLKALSKKDFLVYLDMDDTLLEQWAPFFIEGYHSLTIRENDTVDWHVALTPALENLLRTIRAMNGAIIIYSRNDIQRVEALVDLIPIAGQPLRNFVDGVLAGPYVKGGKFKDLTVIHHRNAIILDDSPESILPAQWGQVIPIEKFKPDIVNLDQGIVPVGTAVHPSWTSGVSPDDYKVSVSSAKPSVQQFMDHHKKLMENIILELDKAHSKSKTGKVSFLAAIEPFSYAERRTGK